MSLYPILSISVHFYQFLPISTNFCPFLPISVHFYPFLPISKHFYTFPHNSTLNKLVLHTICQCDRSEWVSDLRIFVLLITGTISIAASQKLFCVCIIVLYIIYLPFDVNIAAIVRVCELILICAFCCIILHTMFSFRGHLCCILGTSKLFQFRDTRISGESDALSPNAALHVTSEGLGSWAARACAENSMTHFSGAVYLVHIPWAGGESKR